MAERDNLKDRAYAYLRDAIVTGTLEDGSQTSVYQLADQLSMSRTPVREAVLQLADAGLVTIEKNRGIRIHGVTVTKIRDIFEMRLLLEVPAASFVARYGRSPLEESLRAANGEMADSLARGDESTYRLHDRAFHDHLADATGNHQLWAALNSLRSVLHGSGTGVTFGGRDPQEVIDEHVAIAEAIAAGDAGNAALFMREHLVRTGSILLAEVSGRTGEAVDRDWPDRMSVSYEHRADAGMA